MSVDANLSEDETRERALSDPHIAPLLVGKEIVRIVVVPKKLVNVVLR
jgi:leucyl-tRNA synthetase